MNKNISASSSPPSNNGSRVPRLCRSKGKKKLTSKNSTGSIQRSKSHSSFQEPSALPLENIHEAQEISITPTTTISIHQKISFSKDPRKRSQRSVSSANILAKKSFKDSKGSKGKRRKNSSSKLKKRRNTFSIPSLSIRKEKSAYSRHCLSPDLPIVYEYVSDSQLLPFLNSGELYGVVEGNVLENILVMLNMIIPLFTPNFYNITESVRNRTIIMSCIEGNIDLNHEFNTFIQFEDEANLGQIKEESDILSLPAQETEKLFSSWYKNEITKVKPSQLINYMCNKSNQDPLQTLYIKANNITNWFKMILAQHSQCNEDEKAKNFAFVYGMAQEASKSRNIPLLMNIYPSLSSNRLLASYQMALQSTQKTKNEFTKNIQKWQTLLQTYRNFQTATTLCRVNDGCLLLLESMAHSMIRIREIPTFSPEPESEEGGSSALMISTAKIIAVYNQILLFYKWNPEFMSWLRRDGETIHENDIDATTLDMYSGLFPVIDELGQDVNEDDWELWLEDNQ